MFQARGSQGLGSSKGSIAIWIFCAFLFLGLPDYGDAYSVLSHEAIVDAVWATNIVPLLKQRFPNPTVDQLREAHAYAYGGSIIQDMGYYPYGNHFFSDLTHYMRTGDFVLAMLRDARDINEYAFAIGAMSHYSADNAGHAVAINRVVPMLYPSLRKKYGDEITYEDDPVAHVKSEFGFDVVQVAKQRYAPDAYRDFIGFEVAQPLLERAFKEIYGVELSMVLKDEPKAIGSYRHAVSKLIPKATRVAWQVKKNDIQQDVPGITRDKFLYNISRSSYEKQWGHDYSKPTTNERFLAFLFRLIPKIGPLKVATFHTPTPQAELLFEQSFNATLDRYRKHLTELADGDVELPNENLDVGEETPPGKYRLNDEIYAQLLDRLAKQNYAGTSPELAHTIEEFYADPSAPNTIKQDAARWTRVQNELQGLRSSRNSAFEIAEVP